MKRCRPALGSSLLLPLLLLMGAAQTENALPATPLRLLDGGTLDLRSLTGQVVVVRFLASW